MRTVMQTTRRDNDQLRLLSVPLEVLLHITSSLTTVEYGSLRRTCKQVEATLFNPFSQEFFSKKQFMISQFSLQALVDISKSRFSSTLSHVILGLEQPPRAVLLPPTGIDDDQRSKLDRTYQEWADWIIFTNSDRHVEMLAEAFRNLSNLQTVGLRDFSSYTRYRDFPNHQWRSYGSSTFEQNTGTPLVIPRHTSGELSLYASHVFLSLLRALGKASVKPEHCEVIFRRTTLDDYAFNVPNYLQHLLQPVLSNIRTLFLDFNNHYPAIQVDIDGEKVMCANYHLRKFLAEASQLEHLRLNFHAGRYENQSNIDDLLSWLAKPVSSDVHSGNASTKPGFQYIQPVKFGQLRELDIGMVRVESKVLLSLIRKYRVTLRVISFHKVWLLESEANYSEGIPNLWARLFGQMQKLDLKLSGVNFSNLSQDMRGSGLPEVLFKDSNHPEWLKWAGTDIQSGLRDFKALVMTQEPKNDTDIDVVEESEGDSDGNDIDSDDGENHIDSDDEENVTDDD